MRSLVYLFALLLFAALYNPAAVFSQEIEAEMQSAGDTMQVAATDSSALFTVDGGGTEFLVYIDTVFAGTAPLEALPVAPGEHIVRYVHPRGRDWQYAPVVETLMISPGEHVMRAPRAPVLYTITSEPYGAEVHSGDSVLGATPLTIPLERTSSTMTLTRTGYEETTLLRSPDAMKAHVVLRPLPGSGFNGASPYGEEKIRTRSSLPIYVTTAAAIITGISAAYFKVKADNTYADYRATGDESKVRKINNYDRISGISLIATEVNLAALTYFLIKQ